MYVKLESPDKSESQLWAATDGYPITSGKVNSPDELDDFGDNFIHFWDNGTPLRWCEFLPRNGVDVKCAVTSGQIYVEDETGQTVERVK